MYHETKPKLWIAGIVCALLAVLVAAVFFLTERGASDSGVEQKMEQAAMRCARQCYAVEGAYPESIEYLEKNYGLRLNTRDYYVTYEIFAENVPPEVRVVRRSES